MTLRVTTKDGEPMVITDDPVRYRKYIERITARFGNHVYRNGNFIPRAELDQEEKEVSDNDLVG